MKGRSRQAATRSTASRPASHASAVKSDAPALPSPFAAWEGWFRQAGVGQQLELLRLADRQGYLSLHQLPPPKEATQRPVAPVGCTNILGRLLAGELPPLAPVLAPNADRAKPHEAAIVAALASPELSLWRRGPGKDSSAAIAELLRRAAALGHRVLLLAPNPAPVERVLRELAADTDLLALRFTAPGEKAANGPLTRFAPEEQRRLLRDRLFREAETTLAQFESERRRHEQEEAVWPLLAEICQPLSALERQHRGMHARLERVADEVQREAAAMPIGDRTFPSGPFAVELALLQVQHVQLVSAYEQQIRSLQDRGEAIDRSLAPLDATRATYAPRASAWAGRRWWSLAFWFALLTPGRGRRDADDARSQAELQNARAQIEAEQQGIHRAIEEAEQHFTQDKAALAANEIRRRSTDLQQQIIDVAARIEALQQRWREAVLRLANPGNRPAETTVTAIAVARERWRAAGQASEAGRDSALQWSEVLRHAADELLDNLPRLSPIVAGTPLALAQNADFAAACQDGEFDLLVLDEAERFAEVELLAVAAKARRWLLVGSAPDSDPRSCPSRPTPFQKLWHLLHPESARAAYAWSVRDDSLTCALMPIEPADESFVECERLADFPEIELRILVRPGSRPRLAEVRFPSTLTPARAKALIYRELQEAAIDRLDRPCRWEETPTGFSLRWETAASDSLSSVELEPGVRELFLASASELTTCRLEFERDAGWQLPQIQDWLRRYLGFLDTGRTFDLT